MQFEQKFSDDFYTIPCNNIEVQCEDDLCSEVKKSVAKIIAKEGYQSYNIISKVLNTEGGNFIGALYEIDVKGKTKNGSKETNIFVKHVPVADFVSSTVSVSICFNNELFVYNDIINVMKELYEEAAVPERERLKAVKCFTESSAHALLLDNLSRKGYETMHRRDVMSLNFAKSAIKELAKLHAISFVLEKKRNDFFENNIKTLKSPFFYHASDDAKDTWKVVLTRVVNMSFNESEVQIDNKQEKIEYCFNKMYETLTNFSSVKASVKCMCHGDFKIGNILMKQKDDGEIDTIMIDYQLLNYGSPIYDIMYFIFTGTDREFRKNHLEYLKHMYHDSLTEYVKYWNIDINSFYPRKIYEQDFNEHLEYGLIISVFFLACYFVQNPDYFKTDFNGDPVMHPSFKERISGIFQDFKEWGIL